MRRAAYQSGPVCSYGTNRILVTGGAGFIGSHFIELLLRSRPNAQITVLDAMTYAADRARRRRFEMDDRVAFVEGDICDRATVRAVMADKHQIFHFAAETHVPNSFLRPDLFHRTNVVGTRNLAVEALANGISRFVHVSTDEVYGETRKFVDEDHPFQPTTPYARSKVYAEKAIQMARRNGLDALIVRPTNAIGPRQHLEKLAPRFVKLAMNGEPLTIEGTGQQERCFLPVSDLAKAILIAAEHSAPMQTYNIPGEEYLSVLEVARLVMKLVEHPVEIRFVPDRKVNDFSYRICGKKIAELGYRQASDVGSEIHRIVRDFTQPAKSQQEHFAEPGRPGAAQVAFT